ncbi:DUF4421 family protein [Flammeovirga yaeyamensis]|uniref:DUF4421 family protein n=1 Tax=Flammeovirga yaeyamensis TaxID=367791 RepID=A0AAX1N2N0_9BACT|nr:DUF4421 domain-containing protein [Flammeovirga yaeyamensis]MBB3696167.1 hypothetical protein [Flammeovirga yaeyamensis]NMF34850.1 DUF4421 domain-containing protein [Flammeovirga yaeyamensis]QWG00322.1 DUF4421 family protein [Flammeovirga yaeyamensis]
MKNYTPYFIFIFFLVGFAANAQKKTYYHDSTYYKSYNDYLHLRLYTVYKFNNLIVNAQNPESEHQQLVYAPNGNLNLGFGFNYKGLGINFGFNFPFINNDNGTLGETKKLDMRSYMYGRRYAIDFGLQFYKGFFLREYNDINPPGTPNPPSEIRGDMRVNTLGITAFKIQNYEKFSFRAAFAQTEVQKKSAGSLIYGPYINLLSVKADSSLVPEHIRDKFHLKSNVIEGNYGSMGLIGGYAQTFVLGQRLFLTGAAAVGYGITYGNYQYATDKGNVNDTAWQGGAKLNGKLSFGYNHGRTYVGTSYVIESYNITTSSDTIALYWMGQFRFNIVQRFNWDVKFLDWILEKKRNVTGG